MANNLLPSKGLLTWNAEGNNEPDSIYYSRRAHWPGGASGVTIGRGYDMKERVREKVKTDLIAAGLTQTQADVLAEGAQLSGDSAKKFVEKEEVKAIEITEEQQVQLFENSFDWYFSDARRICMKEDVEKKYGKCGWENLTPKVTDLIADLRYRGDYTPWLRSEIQKDLLSGDVDKITAALEKIQKTANVPKDRHDRRIQFLKTGVK